ncbi:c-type cytochrome [Sorangium sp. So ce1000]|uniref:c-type cytochrome n=1 Tax=Sorangium sp. So ce1000 TaxID=3133325 RepID=UPI003F5E51BC
MPVRTILLLCFAPFAIGALQGCGGDDGDSSSGGETSGGSLGECPPDSDAQAQAGYQALQDQCVPCHLMDTKGPSRIGAPEDVNVDDPASVTREAEEILAEIKIGGANGADGMPIGSKLSDDTVESIRVFLACDAAK